MIYLLLSVISSSAIFVIFKLSERYSSRLLNIIIINYLTATILGIGFLLNFEFNSFVKFHPWTPYAIIIGLLFIVMFFIIGLSTQKAGIAKTTVAGKMSMIIPILFSILYFSEQVQFLKVTGLIAAFIAVFLSIYKKEARNFKSLIFILPILIFFGSGFIDTLIKYAQHLKIPENETSDFTSLVFLVAFISGVLITILNKIPLKSFLNAPTLLFGIFLGISNYGSLFFLIKALTLSSLDSSLVFAINNMSIVVLSAITGFLIFKEKLSVINLAGIFLAFLSIYFLSFY